MASSDKRRLSFIKFSEKDLKDLGLSTETQTTQDTCQPGTSKQQRLSFVKFSQRDLKDFGLLDNSSEKIEKTCEPVKENHRIKLQNIFPPPNQKTIKSVYKVGSRISRRSSISKKEVKKKNVARINNFLYNISDGNKKIQVSTSKKILGEVKKQCTLGARKELFKIPKVNRATNAKMDWEKSIRKENVHQSPLMDIEKAEILLKKKACLQENLFKASVSPGSIDVPSLSNADEIAQSLSPSTSGTTLLNTNSSSPDLEFEKIEKICEQQERKIQYSTEIRLIHEMLKNDNDEFRKFNEAHKKRMKAIFEILNEIQSHSKCNAGEVGPEHHLGKEKNFLPTEKELRTSATSIQTPVSRTPGWPNNLCDFRMNLLKRNLTKSGNKLRKEKKAQNMYNDLRKTFASLETPTFDRISDRKGKKNISLKLQEQCLLLLETPQQK